MIANNNECRTRVGARPGPGGACEFTVWAPDRENLSLHLLGPGERTLAMTRDRCGYHQVLATGVNAHSRYVYRLENGREFPDPASRFQPEGVHGPSEVVDLAAFPWTDAAWKAPSLEESVFYEVHVGTFSPPGKLESLAACLPELAGLGVTTVELMPVAQFPGTCNWGYDGVFPYAVQNSYGGPAALQRLVNQAHAQGLAVALDVVYNHLGPEGNYLSQFGPYFTGKYRTPWGQAINFDGPQSDPVRRFFIENALYWFEQFHLDVLRLDAIHGIFDFGARHFLEELEAAVELAAQRLGRNLTLVAESDLNDARILRPREQGGYALPAQWSDDFHHSLHTLLTHEAQGYYADFGSVQQLAEVLRQGWYYDGKYSEHRRRRHGNSPRGIPRSHFVVASQNHDQVGNRALGDRLSTLVSFEAQKLAAGVTLLSPFVPLLFMGEEYAETAPFLYFTSHGDKDLAEAVRRGRREEFSAFGWQVEVADPQDPATFSKSTLRHSWRECEPHRTLQEFYRELMRFRGEHHLGAESEWETGEVEGLPVLTMLRRAPGARLFIIFNFGAGDAVLRGGLPAGRWSLRLNSADGRWRGPGDRLPPSAGAGDTITLAGQSLAAFRREEGD